MFVSSSVFPSASFSMRYFLLFFNFLAYTRMLLLELASPSSTFCSDLFVCEPSAFGHVFVSHLLFSVRPIGTMHSNNQLHCSINWSEGLSTMSLQIKYVLYCRYFMTRHLFFFVNTMLQFQLFIRQEHFCHFIIFNPLFQVIVAQFKFKYYVLAAKGPLFVTVAAYHVWTID